MKPNIDSFYKIFLIEDKQTLVDSMIPTGNSWENSLMEEDREIILRDLVIGKTLDSALNFYVNEVFALSVYTYTLTKSYQQDNLEWTYYNLALDPIFPDNSPTEETLYYSLRIKNIILDNFIYNKNET
jgi:hypothetical protein